MAAKRFKMARFKSLAILQTCPVVIEKQRKINMCDVASVKSGMVANDIYTSSNLCRFCCNYVPETSLLACPYVQSILIQLVNA